MGDDSGYLPIKVPPIGDDGYSDRERDDILRGLARSSNFTGKRLDEHNKEIFGHRKYKGMKAQAHDSPCPEVVRLSNRLWWLVGILLTSGGIGGLALSTGLVGG